MATSLLTTPAFVASLAFAFATYCHLLVELAAAESRSSTRHYKFHIKLQIVTRLCRTKAMITVNGKFPGPPIVAREGDRVLVKVVNHVREQRQLPLACMNTSTSLLSHCCANTGS